MLKRIITSVIALPLFIYVMLKGGNLLFMGTILLTVIGLYEFYDAFHKNSYKPYNWAGYLLSLLFYLGIFNGYNSEYYFAILFFITILLLISNVISHNDRINDISITIVAVIYISFGFFHLNLFEKFDNKLLIFLPFVISWGTDTFAYFSGLLLGEKKLLERVSPKKTREGAVGGIIGSVILSFGFAYFFAMDLLLIIILTSFLASIVSQLGDLIASKIKRTNEIKDFGFILPGHGGILDRFDSILLVTPFVYYILNIYILYFK